MVHSTRLESVQAFCLRGFESHLLRRFEICGPRMTNSVINVPFPKSTEPSSFFTVTYLLFPWLVVFGIFMFVRGLLKLKISAMFVLILSLVVYGVALFLLMTYFQFRTL